MLTSVGFANEDEVTGLTYQNPRVSLVKSKFRVFYEGFWLVMSSVLLSNIRVSMYTSESSGLASSCRYA